MKRARTKPVELAVRGKIPTSAQTRTVLLVVVCFVLGIGVGAVSIYRVTHRSSTDAGETGRSLSEGTKAVLQGLDSPVEIRFYSLLDPVTTSDALRDFAERVDQLLSEYQSEAGGKIKVTRRNSRSESDMDAASADGLRAFNFAKGEGSFLGLTVAQEGQKETLAQLAPEWEPALESDLTRAILRVTRAQSVAARITANTQTDAAADEEVKRSLPNFASVSVEEGKQILREAAMKELKAAMNDIETQIKEARQRLSEAQKNNSEAEQQAAMKQLQQSQMQQTEKIKEIAARLQGQIEALKRIKEK